MRQTDDHRRRRQQFMSDALVLAFSDRPDVEVRLTPGGTSYGATQADATIAGVDVDGRTLAKGFEVLWEDRRDRGFKRSAVGVDVAWRDDVLHARTTSNAALLTPADARKILELGLRALLA